MTAGQGAYGPLLPEEREAGVSLVRQGFGSPRDQIERAIDLFGPQVLRGLRGAGGTLVGHAAVWPVDQWFGGRPVPAQGVAAVAVDPAERGRGHGTSLIRAVLDEARADGAALSILYPATLSLYAKAGYGRAGVSVDWSAPPTVLTTAQPPQDGTITRADPQDATPLAALRHSLLTIGNGLLERNEALWSFALCPFGELSDLYRLNGPNGPEGYIAVAPPKQRSLAVADYCVLSRRAARLALSFLAGYRAQVDRVRWRGGPDDPLALLAAETGARVDAREEWLLRVVDIEGALGSRGYPRDVVADLGLDVTDPLFAANSGRFRLRVSGGWGTVARVDPADKLTESGGLSLGIAALATLYSGHNDAALLRQVGLLAGDDDSVATAMRLFAGPSPWMPDRF